MDPEHGNVLVRKTLTCLERELDGRSMPTVHDVDSDMDDDLNNGHGAFVGAMESTLPTALAADAVNRSEHATIGSKKRRRSGDVVP
jgi:hypothetical protein